MFLLSLELRNSLPMPGMSPNRGTLLIVFDMVWVFMPAMTIVSPLLTVNSPLNARPDVCGTCSGDDPAEPAEMVIIWSNWLMLMAVPSFNRLPSWMRGSMLIDAPTFTNAV